jgi:hypothetical protein
MVHRLRPINPTRGVHRMAITLLSDVQRMELPLPTPLIGRWRELDAVTAALLD